MRSYLRRYVYQRIDIIKYSNRLSKTDAMFRDIGNRFIDVPFESHINCMYRNEGCQA